MFILEHWEEQYKEWEHPFMVANRFKCKKEEQENEKDLKKSGTEAQNDEITSRKLWSL